MPQRPIIPSRRALALLTIALSSAGASAQEEQGLQWSVMPYLWGSTTDLDLSFRDASVSPDELSFKDLVDTLDGAFMFQTELGAGYWSVFADVTYLKIANTDVRDQLSIDIDSTQIFADGAVAYWPQGFGSALSIFGGVRHSSFDNSFRFTASNTEIPPAERVSDTDYNDLLLGLRYHTPISDRWGIRTYADYAFGDSEGVFVIRGSFAYSFGKSGQNSAVVGYQYKEAEFTEGDQTNSFTYYGPLVGVEFSF